MILAETGASISARRVFVVVSVLAESTAHRLLLPQFQWSSGGNKELRNTSSVEVATAFFSPIIFDGGG